MGTNVPSEECGDAFHQREETQQLFACTVSVETVSIKIWNQKGSLNIATFAEYTRTLCTQMPDLSCPAGMPQTQLSRFAQTPLPSVAELMRRIEDAAKNQTARNPEFTELDTLGTSRRRVGDEDRDGES